MPRLLRLVFLGLLLLPASCASTNRGDIIERPFTAHDATRSLVLAVGRDFRIELPSNPSTGFDWSSRVEPRDVIAATGRHHEVDESGRLGAAGKTTFTFRSQRPGNATIHFAYGQPAAGGGPPSRTVVFRVTVR